jgi:hypothetical protein
MLWWAAMLLGLAASAAGATCRSCLRRPITARSSHGAGGQLADAIRLPQCRTTRRGYRTCLPRRRRRRGHGVLRDLAGVAKGSRGGAGCTSVAVLYEFGPSARCPDLLRAQMLSQFRSIPRALICDLYTVAERPSPTSRSQVPVSCRTSQHFISDVWLHGWTRPLPMKVPTHCYSSGTADASTLSWERLMSGSPQQGE